MNQGGYEVEARLIKLLLYLFFFFAFLSGLPMSASLIHATQFKRADNWSQYSFMMEVLFEQ